MSNVIPDKKIGGKSKKMGLYSLIEQPFYATLHRQHGFNGRNLRRLTKLFIYLY